MSWKALRWLDVFLGFRQSRYSDVGMDLRPKATTASPSAVTVTIDDDIISVSPGGQAINLQDLTEIDRSVEYEGFYGGVEFRWN